MTTEQPRLLQLGMHFDASLGGVDRYFDGLLGGLETTGTAFTAAAFGSPGNGSGFRFSLGSPDDGFLQKRAALRDFTRQIKPAPWLVATHFALYAQPLLPWLRTRPHVAHFHGPWAEESAREGESRLVVTAKRWMERQVYTSAHRLITLSQAFRDILVRDYHISPDKISVVPGGVDTMRFSPGGDRTAARHHLGWPAGKKIILCVRRMVRRMGLEELIRAFATMAAAYPDSVLVIGGHGPLLETLKSQAAASGVGDRVIFTGFIPDQDLPATYTAADFSIVPSQALEGFGLVTLESLACGCPVLVTPVGGLPEVVTDLDLSLITRDASYEAVAEGIFRGLTQPLPSASLCREYVERNFSWPQITRRILEIYRETASAPLR